MSDAFESQAHFEEVVTSEQARLDLQNPSSNQYEFFGKDCHPDLSADENFHRFYARNNHSESEATRQNFMQQNQVALLGCNFPCDSAIEGGPSSMGIGLHTAGIPDEPTIDPSWIRYDPGENSNRLLLEENVESFQANAFCLPESIRVSPFEALDIAGVAAVDSRNALAHTYPHSIAPDYCWKVQQAELIERIRSTVRRWEHPERGYGYFQCKICLTECSTDSNLKRHFLKAKNCIKIWKNMDIATQMSFDPLAGRVDTLG
ncbi:hypothetical protein MY4038_010337 [Beauveria bassiana]